MFSYLCHNCDWYFEQLKHKRCPNCESENCGYGYWEDDFFYEQPPDEEPLTTNIERTI